MVKNYVYIGHRTPDGEMRVTVEHKGKLWGTLPLRLDLRNHSPTGFECGYCGSGPAQLALALLAHATGKERLALRLYQHYKGWTVAGLDRDDWKLCAVEICESARVLLYQLKHASENPAAPPENPAEQNGKGVDHVAE